MIPSSTNEQRRSLKQLPKENFKHDGLQPQRQNSGNLQPNSSNLYPAAKQHIQMNANKPNMGQYQQQIPQ